MALHHQLQIYRVTYQLLHEAVKVIRHMPRDFKQSIGGELRDECVAMTVQIYRANVATHKVSHIEALRERLQVVELLLRLSKDLELISKGQYATLVRLTQSIGKQATGWKNASSPVG